MSPFGHINCVVGVTQGKFLQDKWGSSSYNSHFCRHICFHVSPGDRAYMFGTWTQNKLGIPHVPFAPYRELYFKRLKVIT